MKLLLFVKSIRMHMIIVSYRTKLLLSLLNINLYMYIASIHTNGRQTVCYLDTLIHYIEDKIA